MPGLTDLAAFASSLRMASMPGELIEKAKTCVIDALYGTFLVASDERAKAALAAVPLDGPDARSTICGSRHRAAPADAAFVNAASSAATDQSDTHAPTATHPGLMTVPPALALAEQRGRDGAALIAGVVAGYETMCRLARALVTPELAAVFRPTALAGPTAGAIAASRVLGLPPDRMVAAASLATQTAAGFNEWAHAGTTEHPFHAAFAVRNAVTAALLGEAGVDAAPTVLEGRSELLAGYGARARAGELTRGLGRDFEMLGIVHKPAPACFFVQAPCQIAARLVKDEKIDADSVQSIEIRVTEAASRYPGCDNRGPMQTQQSAIMSLQFSVASVLAKGGISPRGWREFGDATVNALAARSTVIADRTLTAAYPTRQGAAIRVVRRNGGVLEAAQDDFRSMTRDEVAARFLGGAVPIIGKDRAERAIELIGRLDRLGDVSELAAMLRAA